MEWDAYILSYIGLNQCQSLAVSAADYVSQVAQRQQETVAHLFTERSQDT